MKKAKILFLIIFAYTTSFGQRYDAFQNNKKTNFYHYFILNENIDSKKAIINEIDVASDNKNICDKKMYSAQLYNIFFSEKKGSRNLILFSVMPSREDGNIKWKKVNIDTLKSYIYNLRQLDSLQMQGIEDFERSAYRNTECVKRSNFRVILKKHDGYYVNEGYCLAEFFKTSTFAFHSGFSNQNPINLIDISNPPLSIAEFEMQYLRWNKQYSYNFAYSNNSGLTAFKTPILFYSHQNEINDLRAYYFWTLSTWTSDRVNINRGIDRFIFNPEIGIIGGDYTFYFKQLERAIPSPECEKAFFDQYLLNEVKLNPVKIIKDFK
ncbi:MAG: hypothetical protein V4456_13405 [Bacteroidota bacterium]